MTDGASRRPPGTRSPATPPAAPYELFFGYRDEAAFAAQVEQLVADRVASRLAAKDHTLWGEAAEEESAKRLGWVDLSDAPRSRWSPRSTRSRAELHGRRPDPRRAVRDGRLLARARGHLRRCRRRARRPRLAPTPTSCAPPSTTDLAHTVVVVSSKSGGTVETDSQRRAYEKAFTDAGIDPRERIIVVTDPGSPLDQSATEAGYRVFRADPTVGGRFSALTAFGLVPSGLAGADIGALLAEAEAIRRDLEADSVDNPGLRLGALLGVANLAGVDKLVLCNADAPYAGFGDWAEQLIAESTGKDGKGMLPVIVESPTAAELLAEQRRRGAWAASGRGGSSTTSAPSPAGASASTLRSAPSCCCGSTPPRWRAAIIGINPFDQPDVESAKEAAREHARRRRRPARRRRSPTARSPSTPPGLAVRARQHRARRRHRAAGRPRPRPRLPRGAGLPRPPPRRRAGRRTRDASRRPPGGRPPSAGVRGSCTPPGSTTRADRRPASTSRSPASPSATSRCPTGRSPSTSSSSRRRSATARCSTEHGRPVLRLHLASPATWTPSPLRGASREPVSASAAWTNPLRDPEDRRLPRIAGPVRDGALRRHRRPVAQEGDAGDLRPGQPRPAAAGVQPGRLRPPRLGQPGLRHDRPRLGQAVRPHRVP